MSHDRDTKKRAPSDDEVRAAARLLHNALHDGHLLVEAACEQENPIRFGVALRVIAYSNEK
jgi:hypothetical protein